MTNLTDFAKDLERAQRSTIIDLLRSQRGMTLAESCALRKSLGPPVGSITLEELISGKPGDRPRRKSGRRKKVAKARATGRRRGRPRKVDTRTEAGRTEYDEAILAAAIQLGDTVSADQIRAIAGGSAEQARSALARLVEAKVVKRSGKGRGTQYRAA